MDNSIRTVGGGLVAVALLALYAYLVWSAIAVVSCVSDETCTALAATDFNNVKAQALSVVSGLVSALVISELALTKPGAPPGAKALGEASTRRARNVLRWVTALYIFVWLCVGGAALIAGLNNPDALPALTSVGQSWFGLSVASAYAYFGLKPAA